MVSNIYMCIIILLTYGSHERSNVFCAFEHKLSIVLAHLFFWEFVEISDSRMGPGLLLEPLYYI